jgi:hypothetical protein
MTAQRRSRLALRGQHPPPPPSTTAVTHPPPPVPRRCDDFRATRYRSSFATCTWIPPLLALEDFLGGFRFYVCSLTVPVRVPELRFPCDIIERVEH